MPSPDAYDREPDMLQELMRLIGEAGTLTPEKSLQIERQVRAKWGGDRVFIGKKLSRTPGRDPVSAEVIARVRADLAAGLEPMVIAQRLRIGRSTVARISRKIRGEAAA